MFKESQGANEGHHKALLGEKKPFQKRSQRKKLKHFAQKKTKAEKDHEELYCLLFRYVLISLIILLCNIRLFTLAGLLITCIVHIVIKDI